MLKCPGLVGSLDEQSVADRSKSDAFTKTFAIAQSSWLIVSSIARVHHGLAITELELATMAFIVCALVMYIFWWNKPYGVEQRCLMVAIFPSQESVRDWIEDRERSASTCLFRLPTPDVYRHVSDLSWDDFFWLILEHGVTPSRDLNSFKSRASVALYTSGMAFSAVHVAAWNWEFPSKTVQILWRAASLGALLASAFSFTIAPLLNCLGEGIRRFMSNDKSRLGFRAVFYLPGCWIRSRIGGVFLFSTVSTLIGYVACRLIILVLTIYCFTSMPSSVYAELDWAGYIPHFS